jgi:hypothetical protein
MREVIVAERGPGFHYRQFFGSTASGILALGAILVLSVPEVS